MAMEAVATQLERLGNELKCPICLSPFKQAAVLSCTHFFCKSCILLALKGAPVCPVCKVPATKREVRWSPKIENLVGIYRDMEAAVGIMPLASQDPNVLERHQNTDANAAKRIPSKKRVQAPQFDNATNAAPKKNRLKKRKSVVIEDEDLTPVSLDDFGDFEAELAKAKNWELERCEAASSKMPRRDQQASKKDQARNLPPFFWLSSQDDAAEMSQPRPTLDNASVLPAFSDLKSADNRSSEQDTDDVSKNQGADSDPFFWTQRPCSPELECGNHGDMMNLIVEDSQDPYLPIKNFLESEKEMEPQCETSIKRESVYANKDPSPWMKQTSFPQEDFLRRHQNDPKPVRSPPKQKQTRASPQQSRAPVVEKRKPETSIKNNNEAAAAERNAEAALKRNNAQNVEAAAKQNGAATEQCIASVKCETSHPDSGRAGCAFCQRPDDCSLCGELMSFRNSRLLSRTSGDENLVHKLCAEWAPSVYFTDENETEVKNLESEISRSQKLKCSSCKQKGAALGCCVKSCRKTFHYHCAKSLHGCKWNTTKFLVLCPDHASRKFPGERRKRSSEILEDHNSSDCRAKARDPPNCPDKYVLCASGLDIHEKELLAKFASATGSIVQSSWSRNVTHVIAGTDPTRRTLKLMMGILEGKWVLKPEWLSASISAGHPVEEHPFEARFDVQGKLEDGPRRSRSLVRSQAPKLFHGLDFYFTEPDLSKRMDMETMVRAGGGTVLHRKPVDRLSSSQSTLVIYHRDRKEQRDSAESISDASGAAALEHSWIFDSIAGYRIRPLPKTG